MRLRRALLALGVALALLAPAGALAAQPRASLPDIEDEVMCVECGTALYVSDSPVAQRERSFIREQIARGRTKAQIKDALVTEYGAGVLAAPQRKGFDWSAYLVPIVLVALALAGIALAVRRWRRAPAPAADGPPEDARRLDAELAAFDR